MPDARVSIVFNKEVTMHVSTISHSALRVCVAVTIALSACTDAPTSPGRPDSSPLASQSSPRLQCDANNGGITLPPGFCAIVVADLVIDGGAARARHIAVTPSGDLFVAINSPRNQNPSFGIA